MNRRVWLLAAVMVAGAVANAQDGYWAYCEGQSRAAGGVPEEVWFSAVFGTQEPDRLGLSIKFADYLDARYDNVVVTTCTLTPKNVKDRAAAVNDRERDAKRYRRYGSRVSVTSWSA